jgi:hypothetical protein
MERFVYFRDLEDNAYINTSGNFRGMRQGSSAEVEVYFESPISSSVGPSAFDKITLTVTDAKEKEAMIAIGGALAGAKAGSTVVVADEFGGVFSDDNITAVAGIDLATTAQLRKVESITPAGDGTGASDNANTRQLKAGDSGTTFLVNISTNTAAFRLPDPVAGLNYKFILDITSDAENTKDLIVSTNNNAVNIIGTQLDAGGINDSGVGASVLKIAGSGAVAAAGDRFSVVCDGTHYYVEDAVALTTGIFAIDANAV